LYVPPAHALHSCALSSKKPALQRHASGVIEACGERALAWQCSQDVVPAPGWNVSAGHELHSGVTSPSAVCVYPALHWQRTPPSDGVALLYGDDSLQDVHAVAPSSEANVFPVHDIHGSLAKVFLKCPTRHMLHAPWNG
jgi:hypothetical protein